MAQSVNHASNRFRTPNSIPGSSGPKIAPRPYKATSAITVLFADQDRDSRATPMPIIGLNLASERAAISVLAQTDLL